MAHPADVPARPASQPPATTPTTSDTTWPTGNRKSILQSTSEDKWKPNPTNPINPATSQLFRNVLLLGSKTGQQLGSNWAAKRRSKDQTGRPKRFKTFLRAAHNQNRRQIGSNQRKISAREAISSKKAAHNQNRRQIAVSYTHLTLPTSAIV